MTTEKKLAETHETLTKIMNKLLRVFLESVNQNTNDIRYWCEKLQLHNSISEALGDHLKGLTEEMADADKEKDSEQCKESWRLALQEQKRNLAALVEVAESYQNTTAHLLKQLD